VSVTKNKKGNDMKPSHMKYAVLLLALAAPVQAGMIDGNYLLEQMQNKLIAAQTFSSGYIAGVHDSTSNVIFCSPSEVTLGQLRDMVKNHLIINPSIRHLGADIIITGMLNDIWPCAKKGKML
jgi:hypothetical protein